MRSSIFVLSFQPTRQVCSCTVGLQATGQFGEGREVLRRPDSWTHSHFLDQVIKLTRSLPESCPSLLDFWNALISAVPGEPKTGGMLSSKRLSFLLAIPPTVQLRPLGDLRRV